MSKAFALSVPASSANLGPGFDAIGLALDLRVRDAYLRRLDAVFAEESRAHDELLAAWKCASDAVITARRARRTLERLKDRRLRAFQAEKARRDELELDESNARAYDRARRARETAS